MSESVERRNVQVGVRLRDLLDKDGDAPSYAYVKHDDTTVRESGSATASRFNAVFGPDADNDAVFKAIGRPALDDVLQGFNVCIFVYGQTGSGKTHTMTGTEESKGLIPRCCEELFERVAADGERQYLVRASYIEVYNEKIYDLLQRKRGLDLRLDAAKDEFFAVGIREIVARSAADLADLRARGEQSKVMGVSNLNEHSSRSHCIFSIVVETAQKADAGEAGTVAAVGGDAAMAATAGLVTVARLQLVDLAGSETLSSMQSSRRRETGAINTSLASLKSVIKAKAENAPHIPYRNSQLTKLLKGSLGGNSLTHMLCCLNPSPSQKRESKFTLSFGSLARRIENVPLRNETSDEGEALLRKYREELAQMRSKLAQLSEAERDREIKLSEREKRLEERSGRLDAQLDALDEVSRILEREHRILRDKEQQVRKREADLEDLPAAAPPAAAASQEALAALQGENAELQNALAEQRSIVFAMRLQLDKCGERFRQGAPAPRPRLTKAVSGASDYGAASKVPVLRKPQEGLQHPYM